MRDTQPRPKNVLQALLTEVDTDLAAIPENGRVTARERERQFFVPLHIGGREASATTITGEGDGFVDGNGLILKHRSTPAQFKYDAPFRGSREEE
ncbi:hypothetical protein [Burkholderia multivorans]|uniref:hypothetical protein n=1 Tax=Burkholderia multivorans TaxID=87883 RepID=UPI0015E384C2|nr:hypothetical protein [Burkholderia multivorans]MBU9147137.1 hypothetical protein [Burkholderia multivorans]MBU9515921.1 hypothetical protein [Burkholderia multivorans]MBU9540984.1 hypothetical protein [Burkholderia multivorans]MBU9639320.1 hypothetical protein [Burkholderia multivorans]HEF4774370.1 hypothetical protein [Burkholderia multivorans]